MSTAATMEYKASAVQRTKSRSLLSLLAPVIALPWSADAITFVQFLNLFNIFVGLFLTTTILVFLGGLGTYFLRLGTWPNHRDQALKVMEWGVVMLFVLVVLVAIVQAFERHTQIAMTVLGGIVILVVAGLALRFVMTQEHDEKPSGNGGPR